MEASTLEALGESLASYNEWVASGILVQVHESIDPISEAIEVDLASTLGFPIQGGYGFPFDQSCVSKSFSNFVFEPYFRICFSN